LLQTSTLTDEQWTALQALPVVQLWAPVGVDVAVLTRIRDLARAE